MTTTGSTNNTAHRWRFFSAGGFDQVRLDRGEDLARLGQLDQKLWVALSCPVQGLEFDSRTLALLDSDNDGHIRAPELIAAIEWAVARLKTPDTLIAGGALPLSAIDDSDEAGRQLLASARQILNSQGKADAGHIDAEDTADSARIFAGMPFNGDGVIAASALDADLVASFDEIVATCGSVADRSGEPGIDQATLDRFFSRRRRTRCLAPRARRRPQRCGRSPTRPRAPPPTPLSSPSATRSTTFSPAAG